MTAIKIGRVIVKTRGRDAGRKGVIIDLIDENFAMVTGPTSLTGLRRKRVNIKHLEPLPKEINIKSNASDDDVLKAIQSANLEDFMKKPL